MSALEQDDDLELLTPESLSSEIAFRPGCSSVTPENLSRPEYTAFGNLKNGQIPTDMLQTMKRHDGPQSVYFIRTDRWVKIGYSSEVKKRVFQFRLHSPLPVSLIASIEISAPCVRRLNQWPEWSCWDTGIWAESWFHRRFAAKHYQGEWFEISDEDVMAAIRDWEAFTR